MRSRNSGRWRTVDVARLAGCSVQQVRNLENEGVLPPAIRTDAGYRMYGEAHLWSVRAYRSLAAGAGPGAAKQIMRAAQAGAGPEMLALLDAVHGQLDGERRELEIARAAARLIAEEPITDARPSDEMGVTELAEALGVRASTLRHWDAMGLVVPGRGDSRGARRYTPAEVRDARIVHQLRAAGYRIPQLQELMPQFRGARRWDAVMAGLAARDKSIENRSRALFEGTATLSTAISAAAGEGRSTSTEGTPVSD
ncbi:MerR family transcriptional regulator [Nocardia sp. NPDC059091]|uniref:MerR family transcriptional regulator n=1 Tax=Nocardia sp. NPDC059091 TaxID=3346724 RepID=UPI0036CF63BA